MATMRGQYLNGTRDDGKSACLKNLDFVTFENIKPGIHYEKNILLSFSALSDHTPQAHNSVEFVVEIDL